MRVLININSNIGYQLFAVEAISETSNMARSRFESNNYVRRMFDSNSCNIASCNIVKILIAAAEELRFIVVNYRTKDYVCNYKINH